jgi:hypothetical protein
MSLAPALSCTKWSPLASRHTVTPEKTADRLGLLDLQERRAGVTEGKEQLGVLFATDRVVTPVRVGRQIGGGSGGGAYAGVLEGLPEGPVYEAAHGCDPWGCLRARGGRMAGAGVSSRRSPPAPVVVGGDASELGCR